jgi:hypothetical protein
VQAKDDLFHFDKLNGPWSMDRNVHFGADVQCARKKKQEVKDVEDIVHE